MALFTQAIAGNRSNPATWGNVVTPGDLDTCACKFALNWDTSTPIGLGGATGTEAIKIEAGGVLTVPDGVTMVNKGDINVARGGRYTQHGEINPVIGSGVTYVVKGLATGSGLSVIEFLGTSKTNRAIATKTGAGVFRIVGDSTYRYCSITFEHFTGIGLGSDTLSAMTHNCAEPGAVSRGHDTAWIQCGSVTVSEVGATNTFDWDDILVSKPLNVNYATNFLASLDASATGQRLLNRLRIYSDVACYTVVNMRDLSHEDWLFVNCAMQTNATNTVRNTGTGMLGIYDSVTPVGRTLFSRQSESGNTYDDVAIVARCDNQHFFGASLGSVGLPKSVLGRVLFDGDGYVGPTDEGDCFFPSGEIVTHNVLCINKAGTPFSGLNTTGSIEFHNLTSDDCWHIAVGESAAKPEQLRVVERCLFTNQDSGVKQLASFVPQSVMSLRNNAFHNMTNATNLSHPTLGVRSYMGPEAYGSWYTSGSFDGSASRGSGDVAADPDYVDRTRSIRKWFGHAMGVDTSNTVTWTPTMLGAEAIKSFGMDKDGNAVTPAAWFNVSACLDWVYAGFVPQNEALRLAGDGVGYIGAAPMPLESNGVNHVWIDDLTTKYRRGGEEGISGPSNLTMDIYRNCIESFQILIHSEAGLSNVDVVISAISGPNGATITDIYKYFQWYHKCTNVSRVEYEPGEYPDALIPDVDRYWHEKRNRFPFSVAAGKVQGVLFDIGTVDSQPVGTYTATVTIAADGATIGTCSVSFVVHNVVLSSTSDFPVDIPALSPHVGYGFPWTTTSQYWYNLMADHAKCGLYHDVSISCNWISGGFNGMTWNNETQQLVVNSWLPQDAWIVPIANESFIADGPYAGAKQAVIRPYRFWPADNSTVPMEYRSLATRQYFTQMWDHLVSINAEPEKYFFIPPFYDEPSASEYTPSNFRGPTTAQSYFANNETVKDTIHLNNGTFRRTFLTCAKNESLAEFELYGFFAVGTQAPACKTYDHTCIYEVPSSLHTRDKYDPSEHWWLYPTCASNACGQVGSTMYSGSADIVVDADALYHLFHGPLWYLYKATGSLYWSVISALPSGISNGIYDPWDNAWRNNLGDGQNNGDSLMIYPGVASGTNRALTPATPIIGGTHDIPIESWRMKTLWRDAIRFVRLCWAAEAKHGRAAVLAVVNTLFETGYPDEQKYWHLNLDPDYYRAAKQGILELAASAVTVPAPVISALSVPAVTGPTTATATLSTTVSGGNLRYVVTANATETNETILAGTAQAVIASGLQTVNMTGLTPGSTARLHVVHDGLGGPSNALHSSEFSTPPVTIPNNAPTGAAIIAGETTVGQTLTASNNIFDADGVGAITYTWRADGVVVGSGSAYVIQPAIVGKYVTVTASYTDGYGSFESVASAPVGPIAPFQPIPEYEQDRIATIVIPCSILCNEETGEPLGFLGADGREYPSVFGRSFGKSGHISVTHIDMSPLPGDCTINAVSGAASFAQGTSSVTVTCDMCGNGSIVIPVLVSNDATLKTLSVETRDGSFVITGNAPATAVTKFKFFIVN